MPKIIPAILTRDADEIQEKLRFLESIPEVTEVQIDFGDGKFVPNQTVAPEDLSTTKTRLDLEAHLMVQNPGSHFHTFENLGFKSVVIHYESFVDADSLIAAIENAKALDLKCGVAINPQTGVGVFDRFIDKIDLCLVMSVHPGFQGKPFLSESLEKISSLRKMHDDAIIEVDGGINLKNFSSVLAHRPDRIVIGSGIWQTPDAKQTIREFLALLRSTN